MKKLLNVIDVWLDVEKTLNLSSRKGSYMDGFHKGGIKAMENVKELLSSQQVVEADAGKKCSLCGEISGDVICAKCITEHINRTA